MIKPWIIAASSGSITVLMPTSCAMTPPRSMSPTSTTGTPAFLAKPILAMSALRRLISAGLPAPSTSTRSARVFSRSKLSSTAPINDGFMAAYSRARAVAIRFPCTMTCAPISVSGFSSTGFMSVCGSTPAASAWSAWARPISPPSTVTAALFDMFCGLNGSTRRPRRVKARARPATMSDLPTSEPAPWIINARAIAEPNQNSTPACALMPERKGCLTSVISVTRSAISISSSLALRPVSTTCVIGGFEVVRKSTISAMSR